MPGVHNWLNLTAGAVRFFKFGSPHQVFLLFEVCAPKTCGKLAKTLAIKTMNNVVEVQLEWKYVPEDYFDEPIFIKEREFELSISKGVALAKVHPSVYSQQPQIKEHLTQLIQSRFLAVQIRSHKDYTLSKPSRSDLRKDGGKNVFLEVEPMRIKVSMGSPDIVIRDKDGNIFADTKRDRRHKQEWFSNAVTKYRGVDSTLDQMLKSYQMAVKDPKNELVHLYEIRDALSKRFRNKKNAMKNLGISEKEWDILGRLANKAPLEQGRHRGRAAGALRPAKGEELAIARNSAAKLIEEYLCFIEK